MIAEEEVVEDDAGRWSRKRERMVVEEKGDR